MFLIYFEVDIISFSDYFHYFFIVIFISVILLFLRQQLFQYQLPSATLQYKVAANLQPPPDTLLQ